MILNWNTGRPILPEVRILDACTGRILPHTVLWIDTARDLARVIPNGRQDSVVMEGPFVVQWPGPRPAPELIEAAALEMDPADLHLIEQHAQGDN